MYREAWARKPLATLHAQKCSLISAQDDLMALWRAWLAVDAQSTFSTKYHTQYRTKKYNASRWLFSALRSFWNLVLHNRRYLPLISTFWQGRPLAEREREHTQSTPPVLCSSPVVEEVSAHRCEHGQASGLNRNYTTVHNQLDFSSFHNPFASFALTRTISLSLSLANETLAEQHSTLYHSRKQKGVGEKKSNSQTCTY